jgi:hypothetical protein
MRNKKIYLAFSLLMINLPVFGEECWSSFKLKKDQETFSAPRYTTVEFSNGDIRHTLMCDGVGSYTCTWPVEAGYNGPSPKFVPTNIGFTDNNGNPLNLTGAQLNQLIWDNYNQGIFSGTIIIGNGLATFQFDLAADLSSNTVKKL